MSHDNNYYYVHQEFDSSTIKNNNNDHNKNYYDYPKHHGTDFQPWLLDDEKEEGTYSMTPDVTAIKPTVSGEADPGPGPGKKKQSKHKRKLDIRKAPQAPRRFKSSYILFFLDKQAEIKRSLPKGSSVGDVSKRTSEMWKALPLHEREYWDNRASEDKERYLREKEAYTGPWQVPYTRPKKNPLAPKRPMSSFLFFSKAKRKTIQTENPNLNNVEISRILGKMWQDASDEERLPYIEREKIERSKYRVAIEAFNLAEKARKEQCHKKPEVADATKTEDNSKSQNNTNVENDQRSQNEPKQNITIFPSPLTSSRNPNDHTLEKKQQMQYHRCAKSMYTYQDDLNIPYRISKKVATPSIESSQARTRTDGSHQSSYTFIAADPVSSNVNESYDPVFFKGYFDQDPFFSDF